MHDELSTLTREIMDATGLDELTATKVASGQLAASAPPDQAIRPITSSDLRSALTALPTTNEPAVIPWQNECPDCGGGGWYKEAVPYGHPHFGKLFPCHCKLAEKTQHLRARRLEILSELQSELGDDLMRCRLGTFDLRLAHNAAARTSMQKALKTAHAYVSDPRGWLYFYGPTGVGKSHLAAAIGLEIAEAGGMRVTYSSVPRLMRFIKAGFKDDTSDQRLNALQVADLLILDDIGTEYHTEFTDTALFELIGERHNYNRLTILTSNLSPDDLDPRIASRIKGRAQILFVNNTDQRPGLRGAR